MAGQSVFPDFTRKAIARLVGHALHGLRQPGRGRLLERHERAGDLSLPSKTMPRDIQHRIEEPGFATRTATHMEIHNVFGMQNTRGTLRGPAEDRAEYAAVCDDARQLMQAASAMR